MEVLWEVLTPVNVILSTVIVILTWKLFGPKRGDPELAAKVKQLPKMKRRDMTVEELLKYDGDPAKNDGRILVAVNGTVFDVTRGKHFYGPGGPYHAFAGRDASRMLATFNVSTPEGPVKYDDLSDLKSSEMEQVKEWYLQFREKYDIVGRLLKPNEEPTEYSDNEEPTDTSTAGAEAPPQQKK
ncbi:membrane-associated progesterone receptor component 2-like [Tropilaelaps mercedesae]|uniref:Membrane-associated progesterone receptor component 2-like n=1 Tax=Tropilaelaps mercedesae TaxID=418985 RepID=A0A1V9X1Z8_9ACAR|nr:membrane-associated progesterone receptor component 2-like [Tropilaelaps mercedesae]